MEDESDPFDLYDDLVDTKVASKSNEKGETKTNKATTSTTSVNETPSLVVLQQEVQDMKKKMELLEQENRQLKRNMGTLYRTAKAEIKRKDEQIARLVKQLDDDHHQNKR